MFEMVMDRLTNKIRQESLWTTMLVDDIVICSGSRLRRTGEVEVCSGERRNEMKYIHVNGREDSRIVRMKKYLGSTVQSKLECRREVKQE